MSTSSSDFDLPDLPPLADDGSTGTEAPETFGLDADELDARPSVLDDDVADFDFGDGSLLDESDDSSWLGDDEADLDLGDDDVDGTPEDGWLDDRPMHVDLGLGLGLDEGAETVIDEGLEGLEDPTPRANRDDDVNDLPPFVPSVPGGSDDSGVDDEGRIEIDIAG